MSLNKYQIAIFLLYAIASILVIFSVGVIVYPYLAAAGSISQVIFEIESTRILSALFLSITSSIATTILAIIFGIPLAYIFAMVEFRGKDLIETLSIDIPQTFPPIAEGMIFLLLLGPSSPIGLNLSFTFIALVISKFFIAAPFIVSFVCRRFKEIKKSGLDLTARTLGANKFQVFWTVLLPLSYKEIIAGSALCWSRAMGELGGSLLFAGVIPGVTETIPTFVANEAHTLTSAALAATILATASSTLALLYFKRTMKRDD